MASRLIGWSIEVKTEEEKRGDIELVFDQLIDSSADGSTTEGELMIETEEQIEECAGRCRYVI